MAHLVLGFVLMSLISMISSYSFEDPNTDFYNSKDRAVGGRKVGWVDPYDMGYDRSKPYKTYQEYTEDTKSKPAGKTQQCNNKCEINLRRLVNSFLRSTSLIRKEEGLSDSPIRLVSSISPRDLKVLNQFAEHGNDGADIGQISDIFHKIFVENVHYGLSEPSLIDKLKILLSTVSYKIVQSPELTVVSSVMAMLVATLWFLYKTHSYRLALFSLCLTLFFAGFGFTWIRLYEEAEVERYVNIKLNGEVPYHCSGKQMAWYEHMYYRMVGINCLEFYKSRDIRPLLKISPTDVMSETLSSMVIKPATNIGTAYGNFCHKVLVHMPWWLKPIAIPFVFILPPLFIILVMALFLDYRFSFSITGFHMIPSWCGGRRANCGISGGEGDYVREVTRETSIYNSILSDTKSPLFLVNWSGLQKLSSSNLLADNKSESNKEEETTPQETAEADNVVKNEIVETLVKVRQSIENCEPSNMDDKSEPNCSHRRKKNTSDEPIDTSIKSDQC